MSRRSVRRRAITVLGILVGLLLAAVVLPNAAGALPNQPDCKDAPTPEVPGRGVEAFFEPAPATAPAAADPFAPNSTTTIQEQYGYAGLRWNTYALGCAGGVGSPEASVGTTVANWLFTLPKATVAATGAMLGAAYQPTFLKVFDPLITTVVDGLRRSVFEQWVGLVVAGIGFLIVWRARKSSLSGTAAAIGWALFVMMVATVLFRWPLAAGQAADTTVSTTLNSVTAALDQHDAAGRSSTGQAAAGNLHNSLLYQVWLGGEFGDANSVAARKYGAQLFDAQALTWAQAATLTQDPAAGQQIIEAKKAKFKQVAALVEAEDPDAYQYLMGQRTDARVGFAALSLFAVACAVPFLLAASLLVIGALVITRFAVMMFPAIATLGLFPAMRSLVIGVGNTVAAAVLNALVFGVGTAVMVKAFGAVMAPGNGLPSWLVVALVLLLTLVMWYTLRPFHRLTSMAGPGRNHFGEAAGALGSMSRGIGRAGGRLLGTTAGVLLADGATERKKDQDKDRPERAGDKDRVPGRRAEADGETGVDDDGGRVAPATGGRSGAGAGTGPGGRPAAAPPGRAVRGLVGLLGGERGRPRPVEAEGAAGPRDSLVAAEGGLPGPAHRRPSTAVERVSGADRSPVTVERSIPAPSGPAPARSGRPGPRRSEGADLDDAPARPPSGRPGRPAVDPRPAPADDLDGEEVYAVYRPEDPASGDVRV